VLVIVATAGTISIIASKRGAAYSARFGGSIERRHGLAVMGYCLEAGREIETRGFGEGYIKAG